MTHIDPFSFETIEFQELLKQLQMQTASLNTIHDWPADQFQLMAKTGVLGWGVPLAFGGAELSSLEMTAGYEQLSTACMMTTFVLTQQNGACQRIAGSDNFELKQKLLPAVVAGKYYITVGISHLTTSRQHLKKPAIEVNQDNETFILNGTIPWVTGAHRAEYIITGGTCGDGREVLVALPTAAEGVEILPAADMLSMSASQTGPVKLNQVKVNNEYIVAGPVKNVMQQGVGGGTGSLTTSALAIGSAEAALRGIQREAENRTELKAIFKQLRDECDLLLVDMYAVAGRPTSDVTQQHTSESIRQRANSLVLRTSQAFLGAAKGAGFVKGHPAERAVREAMFFLVWSCPQPVLQAALEEFACLLDG